MYTMRSAKPGAIRASARAALLLALAFTCGTELSWAWLIKLPPIRLAPPRFVPVDVAPGLAKSTAIRPIGTELNASERLFTPSELFGHPAGQLAGTPAESVSLQFRRADSLEALAKPPAAVAADQPASRLGYAPAVALASQRGNAVTYVAHRALTLYHRMVGETEFVQPLAAAGLPLAAREAAHQIAARLILASLEVTPEPSIFNPTATLDAVRQQLVDNLNRADQLGSRPLGQRVWTDVLATEFPSAVYRPTAQVLPSAKPGLVDYQVRSWLLPDTRTAIDLDGYAEELVAWQRSRRQSLDALLGSSGLARPNGQLRPAQ